MHTESNIQVGYNNRKPISGKNQIIVPSNPNNPGNDGLVILNDELNQKLLLFLQMKISYKEKETMVKDGMINVNKFEVLIIKMIIYNLLEYMRDFQYSKSNTDFIALQNVNMIIYIWEFDMKVLNIFDRNENKEFMNISNEYFNRIIHQIFTNIEENSIKDQIILPTDFNRNFIQQYILNNWDQIYFVGKEKLETWLSPSFLPFPRIAVTEPEFESE
jgi:hypothetical protein